MQINNRAKIISLKGLLNDNGVHEYKITNGKLRAINYEFKREDAKQ